MDHILTVYRIGAWIAMIAWGYLWFQCFVLDQDWAGWPMVGAVAIAAFFAVQARHRAKQKM